MLKITLAAAVLGLNLASASAADHLLHTFKKVRLTDEFWSEGANFGDFNHDGKMDIVSGPFWYEGPDFKKRHEYRPADHFWTRKSADGKEEEVPGYEGANGIRNSYSDCFFTFVYDFNNDGWPDILIYGFPGTEAEWFENPKGRDGDWQRHVIFDKVDNESPMFTDVNGDGKPDIVCNSGGYFGYATADWDHSEKPWKFHPISSKGKWQRFTHGIGVGDVNGDGRMDILESDGWWEQPASLEGDPVWKFHPYPFAPAVSGVPGSTGSSQMYAYDVNGDGKNDVICALAAHGYGLAWYEQTNDDKGEITFIKHIILNPMAGKEKPAPDKYGVSFSQLHAVDLIDMDGDGLKDIVTGKRFWAHGHNGPDPDSDGTAVLYWFQLVRDGKGGAEFIPHLIDNDSGIGTQVVAGNVQNKKFPDVVVGNKKGTFVFLHETKKVSKAKWEKAQPKLVE
ncbi:MAG TPA: VCBS repeat-containing protein [Verrucomicrobiae bacterium]|nr:VCBS repeat-containing protein [Verrucomicrobiae bacterium]